MQLWALRLPEAGWKTRRWTVSPPARQQQPGMWTERSRGGILSLFGPNSQAYSSPIPQQKGIKEMGCGMEPVLLRKCPRTPDQGREGLESCKEVQPPTRAVQPPLPTPPIILHRCVAFSTWRIMNPLLPPPEKQTERKGELKFCGHLYALLVSSLTLQMLGAQLQPPARSMTQRAEAGFPPFGGQQGDCPPGWQGHWRDWGGKVKELKIIKSEQLPPERLQSNGQEGELEIWLGQCFPGPPPCESWAPRLYKVAGNSMNPFHCAHRRFSAEKENVRNTDMECLRPHSCPARVTGGGKPCLHAASPETHPPHQHTRLPASPTVGGTHQVLKRPWLLWVNNKPLSRFFTGQKRFHRLPMKARALLGATKIPSLDK